MKSPHRIIRRLRRLALGLVAIAALVPSSVAASPILDHGASAGSDKAQVYVQPPKAGDTPADFPGASRSPVTSPFVQVVRPERTIVRDANQALPIALSSAALLVALMGAALVLVRLRPQRRQLVGRPH